MVKGKPQKKHPNSKAGPRTKGEDGKEGNTTKGKDKDRRRDKGGAQENIPAHVLEVKNAQQNKPVLLEVNDGANDSPDKDNAGDAESKKYAKRKVESNWYRYEEPEEGDPHLVVEDEYDETKDFEYIRQNSVSALSHFRFKEEEEWEKEAAQHTDADQGSILGLNLVQLATSLQHYSIEDQLSLAAMIPEECKYCIREVLGCTSKPQKLPPYKPMSSRRNLQWSYEGIEKYKYSLNKLDRQNVKESSAFNGSEPTNQNMIECSTPYKSAKSVVNSLQDDDDDILNELLGSKLSIDNDSRDKDEDGDLVDKESEKYIHMNGEGNEITRNSPIYSTIADLQIEGGMVKEDELDLDMLLECDLESPVGENKNLTVDGHTDSDLDQWLDEMLT